MPNNLKFATLITLGVLSGFVFTILAVAAYMLGKFDASWLILATIIFNFLMWLIGPTLTDWMMRIFYKMQFFSADDLAGQYPEIAGFLGKVCSQNGIKVPKVGIIDDDNPTAFTYGSLPSNARMVFTKGLFTYLTEAERQAVLAHEVGHIVHYDFIIMTIASTLVQILYELYAIFSKSRSRNSGGKRDSGLAYIGLLSYVFYLIGTYVLLYLSRTREYYADEFSARTTGDPNTLSNALIKVAYGIVAKKDDERSARLMESTRAMGILDIKAVKGLGLVRQLSDGSETINKVMAFDFVSPWAFVLELGSTHPLTGKRIQRLNDLAESLGKAKIFNIKDVINSMLIDKTKLYNNFMTGAVVYFLPFITVFAGLLYGATSNVGFGPMFLFTGLALIVQALYKFPGGPAVRTTIRELMTDIYSSPVRGKKVILEGQVIGRGEAGAVLSQDLMFQDNGGLIYLDYNSSIGFIGNLLFALGKIKKIIGVSVTAEGWFFRGISQMVALDYLNTPGGRINSYPRLWLIIIGVALILL